MATCSRTVRSAAGSRPLAWVDGDRHGWCGARRRLSSRVGGRTWTIEPTPDPSALRSACCRPWRAPRDGHARPSARRRPRFPVSRSRWRNDGTATAGGSSRLPLLKEPATRSLGSRARRLARALPSAVRFTAQAAGNTALTEIWNGKRWRVQSVPTISGSVLALCGLLQVGEFMRGRRPHLGRATTRHHREVGRQDLAHTGNTSAR